MMLIVTSALIYALLIAAAGIGLKQLLSSPTPQNPQSEFVSIIIPARNEAPVIGTCLQALLKQTAAADSYEIIVIDDHSTDNTASLVAALAQRVARVTLITAPAAESQSSKKAAITAGIAAARGELILTTDADCIVPAAWVENMRNAFPPDVAAVASWLRVRSENAILQKIEALDSAALVLVGAACFGLGRPVLANGANFGYRKSVFHELGGFDDHAHLGSGDDDLLLQNIHRHPRWRVHFITDPGNTVWTAAQSRFRDVLQQRLRWASKAGVYPGPVLLLEIFLYLYFLGTVAAIPAALFGAPALLLLPAIKFIADSWFMRRGLQIWGERLSVFTFLAAEGIQLLYILWVGVWGMLGSYSWKGRRFHRGKRTKK